MAFDLVEAEYWVTTPSRLPETRWSGVYSVTGSLVMTTPQACIEAWRTSPSTFIAASISFCVSGLEAYHRLNSGTSSSAFVIDVNIGIILDVFSQRSYGDLSVRPTSRMA